MACTVTPLTLPLPHKIFLRQKQLNLISHTCILCRGSEHSRIWCQLHSNEIGDKYYIGQTLETLFNSVTLKTYGSRGDTASCILHLSRRWNSVISFTFAGERTSLLIYILVRKENGAVEKNYLTLPGLFKSHSAAHRVISHSSMAADTKYLR
jgi:hypothetical protein